MNNIRPFNCSGDDSETEEGEEAEEQEASGERDMAEDESASDLDGIDSAAIYAKWSKKQEGTKRKILIYLTSH